MAKFEISLPTEIMNDMRKIYDNADDIFKAMTQAGAEAVMGNMTQFAPPAFKDSNIMNCLRMTRPYKTPTDGGINTKVAFYGYFTNKNGEVVPAPLVVNVFEHGRSNLPFKKHPFVRKSFNRSNIREAMLKAQKEASGGLLDE